MKENSSIFERLNNWAKNSVTLKLLTIGFLILILLIPTSMLTSLINEREVLRNDAINEVSAKWGRTQVVGGPVLSVPYRYNYKNSDGDIVSAIGYAHFLPDNIHVSGNIQPEKRYRGIYVVVLYKTKLEIKGTFSFPKFDNFNISASDLILKDAFISVGISDLKGINENIQFNWNDTSFQFNPGIPTTNVFESGISVPVNLEQIASKYTFNFNVDMNGSNFLGFLPLARETNVSLHSTWSDPGFEGEFLPDQRTISDTGFTAQWKVLELNRNIPQQWLNDLAQLKSVEPSYDYRGETILPGAAFGVKFLLPVDEYQKTMRSAKYNIMFIIITFLAFFFVEVLNRKRTHPIQYLLVGFAICIFYVLLLSISEHIKFDYAYLIGCIIVLAIVTFYAKSIYKSTYLAGLIGSIMAILYGFFYSLLQLQDYALLMGSIGLLLILAAIMYLTRNINWYNISGEGND